MNKPIYVLTTVAVVAVVVSIAWAVSQSPTVTAPETNEATAIAEIFKQGLKTNQTNNPNLADEDMFGAALVSIALERFGNYPDAAPRMFAAFDQHATGKPPREQYSLWDVFLENLEGALLKCRDADHLQANWGFRQKAVEKQTAALKEWAGATGKELDEYAQTVSKLANLADIELAPDVPEAKEAIEFLLGDADVAEFDKTELQKKPLTLRQ